MTKVEKLVWGAREACFQGDSSEGDSHLPVQEVLFLLEEIRQLETKIERLERKLQLPPAWLSQALNSGNGTYKP